MCGICGIAGNATEPLIQNMMARIVHRGPDDEGLHLTESSAGDRIGLGHRRLSIIDLSPGGHQPMADSNGQIWLTYNGEIYNFKALRTELEGRGHKFHTESDAEVLVSAYIEWGEKCLERLNGMFAFAIWDGRNDTLLLARDRLGIKPLYYAETPAGFAFASEIKALLAIPGVERSIDLQALDQFMTFLWTPDPGTILKGVYKLPPAHYLTWRAGRITIHEYWDVSFEPDQSLTENEWIERLRAQITRSVQSQLVSDVPLGAFLSGGLDSSTIVALMSDHGTKQTTTYTFGFQPEDLKYDILEDDVVYARMIGREFRTDYIEELLNPSVMELLPKLVYHMDEPVADPAAITSYLICRAARRRLKVLLSGMGGDEVFAGYPRHLAVRLAEFYNLAPSFMMGPLVRALPGAKPGKFTAPLRNIKKLARSAALPPEERYLGFGTYFSAIDKSDMYSAGLAESIVGFDPYQSHREYFGRVADQDFINQMLYIDLKTFLPCLNLTYTDKTSMAASTEVRVPFLDHELVELTARMPVSLKLRRLTRKYILKKAAEAWLPNKIIYRKKAGFSAPVRAWLVKDMREPVEDLLSEETIRRRGYFDYSAVRRLIDENLSGREDNSLKVYQLLTFELWHRAFVDQGAVEEPSTSAFKVSV